MSKNITTQQKTTAETVVAGKLLSNSNQETTNCQVYSYEELRNEIINSLILDRDGDIDLSAIAKKAGKEIRNFLRSKPGKDALEAIAENGISPIKAKKGGLNEQGTFTNSPQIVLEVLRWINPKVAIGCNQIVIDLFQTGKVELSPAQPAPTPIPTTSLQASRMLANQVLELCGQLEQAEITNTLKSNIIDSQRVREDELITLKAGKYKTVQTERKFELGREINHLVTKLYFKQANGDYRAMHTLAHSAYTKATGLCYLGATNSCYDSKLSYLNFLKSQDKNIIQKMLGI